NAKIALKGSSMLYNAESLGNAADKPIITKISLNCITSFFVCRIFYPVADKKDLILSYLLCFVHG
ncbi:hypothetical protein, partial [Treponema socranskii]